MAKWEPGHGIELIPHGVDNQDFEFALEQAAQVIYKWLLRFESKSPKADFAAAPSLLHSKEIRP